MTEKRKEKDSTGGAQGGRRPSGAAPVVGAGETATLPPNGRWSVRRKQEIVLRMFSGESIDSLSRELGVEPYRLERWREKALNGIETGLKERNGDPLTQELDRAKKTIGDLTMEVELLRKRCREKESLRRRRSR